MTALVSNINSRALTMSSREIAELTGSRHDSVKRSAERLSADQILTSPLVGFDFEHKGNVYQEYRFNKRDSLVLVARLSPEFTAAVVDRWQYLEEQAVLPAWARNLSKAARIALEDLNAQVEHYKGETDRLNAVCNDLADNLREGLTPVAFCRMLNGVNTQRIQPLLVKRRRLIKTKYGYRSAAAYRDKLFTERRYANGEGRPCESVVLTQKGAKWLYSEYEKGNLDMKQDWDGQYSHMLFDDQENAA